MELLKKSINICNNKQQLSTQLQINEDINLPEYMQDIDKIILEKGEFIPEQTKCCTDKIILKGIVKFCLLYSGPNNSDSISAFTKETHFEEEVHIDGLNDHDNVIVDFSEDSCKISIINSRKINAKMLLDFDICVQDIINEHISTAVNEDGAVQTRKCSVNLLEMKLQSNDIFRFHNMYNLPKDKPNIGNIIYENITPREISLQCEDAYIACEGRINIFVLYVPEDGDESLHWLDFEFPINGKIDCAESEKGMVGDLKWILSGKNIELKEDNENESRVLSVDGAFDISMNVYEDLNIDYLDDIYALDMMAEPKYRTIRIPQLLVKNNSVCKILKRMNMADDNNTMLQICNSEADVKIENISMEDNMMVVDGHVFVSMIYISNTDKQAMEVEKAILPFSHSIEVKGANEKCIHRVKPIVESVSANVVSDNEAEINVQIAMDVIIFLHKEIQIIDDVDERPLSKKELNEMPGMVGYVVGENESLWDIAKMYHTTEEKIASINHLGEDGIKEGQKLLILKHVAKG